jgi:uncharacterized protein (TIGR02099 family)
VTAARLWRIVAGVAAGLLVCVALLVTALRIALAYVPQNEQALRGWVERQTQMRIEYASIDARLRWFGPEVVLRDLRVLEPDGSQAMFATREGSVGLDVWNFFRTGQLVAGRVRIVEPRVTLVRLADGRIRLLGLRERPADRPPFDFDRLPAGRVVVADAVVVFRDLKTGRAPIELTHLDVELRRDRDYLLLEGAAELPESLGTRARFEIRLKGSLDERERLDARVEVDAAEVRLTGLRDFLPARVAQPLSGVGPVLAVVAVKQGQLANASLQLGLRDVVLQLPERVLPPIEAVQITQPRLELAPGNRIPYATVTREWVERAPPALPREARYASLGGSFWLRREGMAWVFRAQDLRAQAGERRGDPAANVWGRWSGQAVSAFALELNADTLEIAPVWPLLLGFAPAAFDRYAGLAPTGRVQTLRLDAKRERAGLQPTFTARAELAAVGVQPIGRWPGVSGVSLALEGTDRGGQVRLRGSAPAFDWPRMFRQPLALQRVTADGEWRRVGAAWVVSTKGAELEHAQGRARVDLELTYERPGMSPVLVLDAVVPEVDVSIVPTVVPVGRLRERTIAWLDRAFVRGIATNGRLSYRGPTKKFPFRGGEGEFTATADARNVTLDYYPGFAPVTNVTGSARFHNASIEAGVSSAELGGLKVSQASFAMADYRAPVLEVRGKASGDLQKALAYVQASPLGPVVGEVFMGLSGSGPARYDVQLTLPAITPEALAELAAPPPSRDYTVRAQLDGVTVTLPALRAPAQQVRGAFELHNYEIRAEGMRGTILDGPFELSATPGRTAREVEAAVDIVARGRAGGPKLPAFIGLPATVTMGGTADWSLRGRIEKRRESGAWPLTFDVTSPLTGLSIQAPKPFAKAAAESRPTRVRLDMPGARVNDVALESGSARARLRFAVRDNLWRLERGAARFDSQPVALPNQTGLLVSGDWPQFDLGEWIALADVPPGSGGGPTGGQRLMDWLGPVDVHLDRATVFGFEFSDVVAKLRSDGELWRVAVTGPQAEGQVTVPDDFRSRPLVLDMKRLQLVTEQPGEVTGRAAGNLIDPRTLPAVNAVIEDFSWQSRRFGRMVVRLSREPRGLRFDSLVATHPDFSLDASGSWYQEQGAVRTRLDAVFTSSNFAGAARALAYRDAIDADKARITASLEWPGGPSLDALRTMNGTLRVALEDGQLRDIEPGAGRMLGLLSVAQLPRRLSLDFRDVTDEGLAFNSIKGDFDIKAGNAHTRNLLLRGPTVDMGIVGRTGLATEDYDQTIVVSGNPSGPLAVAGALAAGPVIGAGVLVLSQLFKDQLQGLTRAYYHVSGPWDAPVVERISAPPASESGGQIANDPARESPP